MDRPSYGMVFLETVHFKYVSAKETDHISRIQAHRSLCVNL